MERLLFGMDKPGRYLGNETNARAKDWASARVRAALAFPDAYEVGMSHLGLRLLYHILNDMEGVLADRVYAPWYDMEARLRETGEPLFALESGRPLRDFDLLGFSLQYELSYTNVLTILDLAGIPLRARDRADSDPFVAGGGPCALNPEPVADFFDFFILGEAEEALPEVVRALEAWKAGGGGPRGEFLRLLSRIEGVYVPSFFEVSYLDDGRIAEIAPRFPGYSRVTRRVIADLDACSPIPARPLVPVMEIIHDRLTVEIARGCTRGCRFCQAGFIYRPVRERRPEAVLSGACAALAESGFEEVSLLSLSTGDYCGVQPLLSGLMERLFPERTAVALPSMRVGTLTPGLMEQILRVRKTGFTLAPEAASERLRRVINKGITNEDLLAAAENAFRLGWKLIKLYFMIGLPTETEADIEELANRALEVWDVAKRRGASLNVSVATFVPKPHTPFQWEPQLPGAEVARRLDYLKGALRRPGLRLKWSDPAQSTLEAVFSRGDRRLAPVLLRAWELGARFDGWGDHLLEETWKAAFAETKTDPAFYANRERAEDETLPWDHLSSRVEKPHLLLERRRAVAEEFTPDCRFDTCSGCGACGEVAPVLHREPPVFPPAARRAAILGPRGESPEHVYLLGYSKTGKARFFGQLEVSRAFARAVRRSGLPAAYSKGFHPHVKISFADALPVGLESEAETAWLTLSAPAPAGEVMARMNEGLPEGLRVEEAVAVPRRVPPSARRAVTYRVLFESPFDAARAESAFEGAHDETLMKKTKRGEAAFRLGDVVLSLRRTAPDALELTLCEGTGSSLRPFALLSHLIGRPAAEDPGIAVRKTGVSALEDMQGGDRTHRQREVP